MREEEATRGAILARLRIEHENFEKEAERAADRHRELKARLLQIDDDCERESAMVEEASETLAAPR